MDNIVKLAKGIKNIPKVNNSSKKLTPKEERDLKAKQKVEQLLEEVNFSGLISHEKNINTEKKISTDELNNVDWLSEQVTVLTEQNEKYRNDYEKLLQNYENLINSKNSGDVVLENDLENKMISNVTTLFNEIQSNYFNMINPMTGQSDLIITPLAFMNRMIMYFPFLNNEKRY